MKTQPPIGGRDKYSEGANLGRGRPSQTYNYEGRSINKLQNSAILLVFQI